MNKLFRKILFVSFFLQALIPVGFMPSFANDEATFVICSGVTGEPVTLSYDGEHHSEGEASLKCPYYNISGSAHLSIPTLPLVNVAYIYIEIKDTNDFVERSAIQSNPTRGPPHISLT